MKKLSLIFLVGCSTVTTVTKEPALTTWEIVLLVAALITGFIFIKWVMR